MCERNAQKTGGMSMKKRFAIAGASGRGFLSYGYPLSPKVDKAGVDVFGYGEEAADKEKIVQVSELVGVYDINPGRARYVGQVLSAPAYDDFDKMIEEARPDCVIVATADYSHVDYVVRALDMGCEVFCEKPMCINAEQCRAILEAEKRNNRKIGICFNMRYDNVILQLKQIMDSGVLGKIYNVNFEWLLSKDYSCAIRKHFS